MSREVSPLSDVTPLQDGTSQYSVTLSDSDDFFDWLANIYPLVVVEATLTIMLILGFLRKNDLWLLINDQ